MNHFSSIFIRSLTILLTCLLLHFQTKAQSRIEIIKANSLEFDESTGVLAQRLIGSVALKHDDAILYCDSALFFDDENRVEAAGNVRINQPGKVTARAKYLEYDGNKKWAYLSQDVTLRDPDMFLQTDRLDYDLKNSVAYYSGGAQIRAEGSNLHSKRGSYHTPSKTFFFKDSVRVFDPEFRLKADTLQFNSYSKVATFFGPTDIITNSSTIYTERGTFDSKKKISNLYQNCHLINSSGNVLEADSLYFMEEEGLGWSYGKVVYLDTTSMIIFKSEVAEFNQKEGFVKAFNDALLMSYEQEDTLYLHADTLIRIKRDSVEFMHAFHKVRGSQGDTRIYCDSLSFNKQDSVFSFFVDPILWMEDYQITSDSMDMFIGEDGFELLKLRESCMMLMRHDSLRFDQTKGLDMDVHFAKKKLSKIEVWGNGESIFFSKDDDDKFSGMNQLESSEIQFIFDEGELMDIYYFHKPSGEYVGANMLKGVYPKLDKFKYHSEELKEVESELVPLLNFEKEPWFLNSFLPIKADEEIVD